MARLNIATTAWQVRTRLRNALLGFVAARQRANLLQQQIRCYGRVLDSSPLVGLLSGLATARASLDASGKEYQRVKALFDQGKNASERALQAAEAAMKHDQIALQTSEARLLAAWGRSVAGQAELPAFVQSLSTLQTSATNFNRREISQEHPVPSGWFLTEGVLPNDRVVTTGAAAVTA